MIRLLRHLVPHHILTLLITETVIIFSSFILASSLVLSVDPTVYLLYDGGLYRILLVEVTILLGLYFHDLYAGIKIRSRIELFLQACEVIGIALLAQAILSYLTPALILPRWLMVTGCGLSLVLLLTWRIFFSGVVVTALGEERLLFLGDSDLVREICDYLEHHPEQGMRAVARLSEEDGEGLAGIGQLRNVVSKEKPGRIVVGFRERRGKVPLADLLEFRFSGIQVEEAATTFEDVLKRVPLEGLRPSQLIYTGDLGPNPLSLAVHELASALLALVTVVVAAPLILVIALAVRFSSPGPILYRQARVGRKGRVFVLYKFRSMFVDAEAATGAVWAAKDDPRVTRVGRWLRRLRLDELPQLVNVLKGEMALVGPRPERPEFVAQLCREIPFYRQRECVRPGLTGWAQINYKYGDTAQDAARKLEYDLYYIKHLSLPLNLYILFHTMKTVLQFRGAQ